MLNSVIIDSVIYKVERVENPIVLDGKLCLGSIDYINSKIELAKEHEGTSAEIKTLMHEIIHGIMEERNLRQIEDNENFIDSFAAGVINLIRYNPNLVEYVRKGEISDGN